MRRIIILSLTCFLSVSLYSQDNKEAQDFTITTTDGITRNLYNTLDSGKTVFVDLFYTTCTYCQIYAPVIEEIYQNHGAGEDNIVFWGISNNLFDPDPVIDQYKLNYNVTNPCAGPDGGGTTAFSIVVEGQNFYGFPTYVVICPDRRMFFDPVYPPTVTGFDPYFAQCMESVGIDDVYKPIPKDVIISTFPNPARNYLSVEINTKADTPQMLDIYNLHGQKVSSFSCEKITGLQTCVIPVGMLPGGIYLIRMISENQVIGSHKFLINRE